MVTIAQIEKTLESGDLTVKQSRAIAEAIELAQRKTQEEVETSLRDWMEKRFMTKEDGARLATDMAEHKADLLKWMFIFWAGQMAGIVALFFKLVK